MDEPTDIPAGTTPDRPDPTLGDLYPLLRRIAADRMRSERAGHTLDATAVVHEAWIRLRSVDPEARADRNHFASIAAATIRRVLVDHARARAAEKRGGDADPVALHTGIAGESGQAVDVLALHDALDRLAEVNADCARVVELRFFAGLTIDETADAMGIGRTTAVRLWRGARAWLKQAMADPEHTDSTRPHPSNPDPSDGAP